MEFNRVSEPVRSQTVFCLALELSTLNSPLVHSALTTLLSGTPAPKNHRLPPKKYILKFVDLCYNRGVQKSPPEPLARKTKKDALLDWSLDAQAGIVESYRRGLKLSTHFIKHMNNTNEFFSLLAMESGIMDVSSIKQMYNGLARLFYRELKKKSVICLPEIGEFELRETGKNGKKVFKGKIIPPYKMVRYVPNRGLREQIKTW